MHLTSRVIMQLYNRAADSLVPLFRIFGPRRELRHARSRMMGFAMMLIGAVVSWIGLGIIEEQRAEAGIIISGDPNADQRARDNGFAYSVEGGGNVGWLSTTSTAGTFYASVVYLDPFTAITSAHGVDSRDGLPETYAFGTSANYNSGIPFSAANIFIHPDYGAAAGQGVDLAVAKFDVPIALSNNVVLATDRPTPGETVWFAGYGVTGSRDRGYVGQDGFARAGTSRATSGAPLLGGSSDLYQNALFLDRLTNPTGLRAAPGDSGGGVFTTDGRLTGILIGGSLDVAIGGSMFLNLSAPTVSSFINSHISAVPEPTSLSLLGLGCIAALKASLRKRSPSPS